MAKLKEDFGNFLASVTKTSNDLKVYADKSFDALPPPLTAVEAAQQVYTGTPDEVNQFAWCVAAVNQEFQESGTWPVPEALEIPEHFITLKRVKEVFDDPAFVKACWLRGVRPRRSVLDERMLFAINVLTNASDRRTLGSKLKSVGVSELEYQSWLGFKPFKQKLVEASERALENAQSAVNMALTKSALEGNMAAITYYNKVTGRFDPDKDRQIADVQGLMKALIEIIMTEVTDPATLQRISTKLAIATQANGVIM